MGRKAPETQATIVSFEEVRKSAKKGKAAGRQFVMPKASKRRDLFSGLAKSEPLPKAKSQKNSKSLKAKTAAEKAMMAQKAAAPQKAPAGTRMPSVKKAPVVQKAAAPQKASVGKKSLAGKKVPAAQKAATTKKAPTTSSKSLTSLRGNAKTVRLNDPAAQAAPAQRVLVSAPIEGVQSQGGARASVDRAQAKRTAQKPGAKRPAVKTTAKKRPHVKGKVATSEQPEAPQEETKESRVARFSNQVKERNEKKKRARKRAKAERAFNKNYGGDGMGASSKASAQGAGDQAGPRAAVYKGEMGSKQKKSTKMQSKGTAGSLVKGLGARISTMNATAAKRVQFSRKLKGALTGVLVIAIAGVMLYGPAQEYYKQMRETDRLYAEYEAVSHRTDTLQTTIDSLQTEEGIEDKARTDLGYVKRDEQAASVKGITVVDDREFSSNIAPGSIPAPETWYSPFLDPFFGYSG